MFNESDKYCPCIDNSLGHTISESPDEIIYDRNGRIYEHSKGDEFYFLMNSKIYFSERDMRWYSEENRVYEKRLGFYVDREGGWYFDPECLDTLSISLKDEMVCISDVKNVYSVDTNHYLGGIFKNLDNSWAASSVEFFSKINIHIDNMYGFASTFYASKYLGQICRNIRLKVPKKCFTLSRSCRITNYIERGTQSAQKLLNVKYQPAFDDFLEDYNIQTARNSDRNIIEEVYYNESLIGYIFQGLGNTLNAQSVCLPKQIDESVVMGFANKFYAVKYLHTIAFAMYPEAIENVPESLLLPWEQEFTANQLQ